MPSQAMRKAYRRLMNRAHSYRFPRCDPFTPLPAASYRSAGPIFDATSIAIASRSILASRSKH